MALSNIFSDFAKTVQQDTSTKGRVVGIDIGSSSIKIVELQNRNDVVTLTTYGELELGPYVEEGPVGKSVVLPASIERQALVDILRESATKAKQAVFAMPLASSFVTVMSLQASATEDVSSRVRVEARKYIPIPIAEVTLDWAQVDSSTDGDVATQDILLAAIQNDALARFNGLMDTIELPNTPIEIECFSAIRSLYTNDESDVAIIDVGATSTKLYIVRNGLLQRMYRVRAGGALFTEKLAATMGCSFEEAELRKRSIVATDEQFAAIQKQHHMTYDRVMKEFRQVLDEYEAKLQVQIGSIYLIGGGSLFPGFDNFIGTVLSHKVKIETPFNKVAYPAFMEDTMNSIGSTFAIALGAALRSFE